MTKEQLEFIYFAVRQIEQGFANQLWKGNITVYKCGTTIRIDFKKEKEN